MPQSRIIRMSLLILLVGVGLWGVLVLPSFSQDPDLTAPPAGVAPVQNDLPPTGLGAPGGTAPAAGALLGEPSVGPGAVPGLPGEGAGGGGAGGVTSDLFNPSNPASPGGFAQGASGAAAPAGGAGIAPGPSMGMMGGMPWGTRLSPSQIEEIKLARHAKTLLSRYSQEQTAEAKEKLKSELRSVLHRQFRLQHQRRDSELTKIEKRLADLRSRLKKRSDAQSTIVDRRLEQLVNDVDGLGWNADEIPDNLFNEGGMDSMMMMPGMPGMGSGMGGMPATFGPPGSGLGSLGGGATGGGGTGFGTVAGPEAGGTGLGDVDPFSPADPLTPVPSSSDDADAPGSLDDSGSSNKTSAPLNPHGTNLPANPGSDAFPEPDAGPKPS